MKLLAAIASLLLGVSVLYGADTAEKFPDFMGLGKEAAAVSARKQAEADFASGKYRVLVCGMRRAKSPAEVFLAKQGVETKSIAGCVVSDGILEGLRVYNDIMRAKLKAKLGRDIFDEAEKADHTPAEK
jgi:hypothetical protein